MSYIAISILTPLLTAVFILLLRRRAAPLAVIAALISLFSSIQLLLVVNTGVIEKIILPGLPNLPLRLIASPLTVLLLTMVTSISSFVLIYAIGYMKQDKEKPRFFASMLFFISAMEILVLAGDWILLLSAWELIGLSSYLLIGFWYQNKGVKVAATRAFLVTRTADLGLYIAVFVLIASSGSSDIAITLKTSGTAANVAGLLILVAAMGKSAQTPMHDWLQRAMAGPTPVSALLHSATLVAAGAILIIRVAPMLPGETLLVVGIVGGVTTVITGLIALAETDLKRLLAASTSSQYGLMLLAVGAGVPMAALLHLMAHAAIKSSLFMGAGVFQHSRKSTEFTALKGVGRDRPVIFAGFVLSALALAGIPPLSGFFSKDAVIAATLSSPDLWLFTPLALAGTLLTGAYMAKALRLLWQGKKEKKNLKGLGSMRVGFGSLVLLAIVLGIAFPFMESLLNMPIKTSVLAMILGISSALTGLLLGWLIPPSKLLGPFLRRAESGFSVAGGMDNLIVRPVMAIANACNKLEIQLYQVVLGVGRLGYRIAQIMRKTDEKGIDKFIFFIVRKVIDFGSQARAIQSGLIHRELAISVIVTGFILATSFIAILFY